MPRGGAYAVPCPDQFWKIPHLEGFPREGLLQFFVDTNQERFEAKIDDPNTRRQLYSVRYYPSPDAALQQTVELQRFVPTKVITTVIVNGEKMTEEEYRKPKRWMGSRSVYLCL